MPVAPKRACPVARCSHFTPCPLHNRRQWKGVVPDRYARGYGRLWQQLRAAILDRDGYRCQAVVLLPSQLPASAGRYHGLCGASATHVDHILPKSRGGLDDPNNLITLCAHHHGSKTGREGKAAQASRPDHQRQHWRLY